MSARRLNDSEKQEIIALYRTSSETSISLAERFGVSNSTIGRVLKNGIDSEEYDALVQQKRGRSGDAKSGTKPKPKKSAPRKRPAVKKEIVEEIVDEGLLEEDADLVEEDEDLIEDEDFEDENEPADPEYLELAAELQEDDEDDEEFDDEDDFDDEEEDDFDEDDDEIAVQLEAADQLTVLPLSDASIPRVFYLVVDRGAELVAPPLGEFGELGEMSSEEATQPTLPMFDNHRVAKRFSNSRTQRVIKVPDNQLFYKTTRHLSAKGIKRFLLDGQVYTLV